MCENLPMRCRGEMQNGSESGCKNRKRRRNSTDTVDVDSGQQDIMAAARRRRGDCRTLEGSRGAVVCISFDAPHQRFP